MGGECDVAVFDKFLKQTGEGIRYSKDRDAAYKLMDGELSGGAVDLEEALRIMELEETPAKRIKDKIPNLTGYDPGRQKNNVSWFNYRKMAGLPLHESPFGPSPYPPVWRAQEVAAG